MATTRAPERHQSLIDELIADVETYNPDVDRDLLTRAFLYAADAHDGQQRRSGEPFIHHPWGAAKICAELHLDDETIAAALLHDVVEDTDDRPRRHPRRVRRRGRAARRGRDEADADQLPEPRAGRGRELPEDDPGDGRGRAGDPDQARRPPAQHADDRVPRQAEADPEGEGDARGLRAARAPARHPLAQVGARGPRVRAAAPAQVRRDQGDGERAPRRARRRASTTRRRS